MRQREYLRESDPYPTLVDMSSVRYRFDSQYALPNAAYRAPELLAAEITGLWHADWVLVTIEDALQTRCDQLPVVVGDQPVLLLRKQDGELSALSNLCPHRGTLLVERPTNAYSALPRLGRTPTSGNCTRCRSPRAAHCPSNYRVESWRGLIFVSLNPHSQSRWFTTSARENSFVSASVSDRIRRDM